MSKDSFIKFEFPKKLFDRILLTTDFATAKEARKVGWIFLKEGYEIRCRRP